MLDGRGSLGTSPALHIALALVCWVVVVLRRPDESTGRAGLRLWSGLLALAVATTLDAWPAWGLLDALDPSVAVAGALYGALTIYAAGLGGLAIVEWAAPDRLTPRVRRLVDVVLVLVVVAELVALLSLPRDVTVVDVPDARLPIALAAHPQAWVSTVLTPPILLLAVVMTSLCCVWYGRLDPGGPATHALRRILAGNLFLTAWLVLRFAGLALIIRGGDRAVAGPLIRTSDVMFEIALVGYLTAFLNVRDTLAALRSAFGARHALRRMRPQWRRVVADHPEVVLSPAGWWRDALDPRDLGLRRYRRVIEFRDAVLLLRPWVCTSRRARIRDWLGRHHADTLSGPDLDLVADAVELELARQDAAAGVTARVDPSAPEDHRLGVLLRGADDVEGEVSVLARASGHGRRIRRAVEEFAGAAV